MRRAFISAVVFGVFALSVPRVVTAEDSDDVPVELPSKVTFIGFTQNDDKSSRLFIHFAGEPLGISSRAEGTRVVYTLQGTDIGSRNNRYPLNLKHFDALLVRAKMRQTGPDVELKLTLRAAAPTTHKMQRRGDGSLVLHIDFPPPPPPSPAVAPTVGAD